MASKSVTRSAGGQAPARGGQRSMKDFAALLNKMEDRIAVVATRHLTPERIIKVALSAASRQPRLIDCTPESLLNALMDASQIGLEPGGPAQHAALIPRKNGRTKRTEAHFEVMYQGFRELILRSGNYRDMEARAVYERDEFEYQYGLHPDLVHRPYSGNDDRGPLVFVYSIAWPKADPKTGTEPRPSFDVMTRAEVEAIRRRSRSSDDGPWVTDFDEMAKKTVVKRHRKILRLDSDTSSAVQRAIEIEDIGDGVSVGRVIDPSAFDDADDGTPTEPDEPATKSDELAKKAKKARKVAPRSEPEPEPDDDDDDQEDDDKAPAEDDEDGDDEGPVLSAKGEQLVNLREKAREFGVLDSAAEQDIADVLEDGDDEGIVLWIKHLTREVAKAAAEAE